MKLSCLPVVCLMFGFLTSTSSVLAQTPVRGEARTFYVSGGVGEDSRELMQAQAAQFNVRAMYALKSGAYLSGVEVVVVESGTVVISTVTEGPWLYAQLAPGNYETWATVRGRRETQRFTVPAQGSRQLVFRWESDED